MSFCKQAAHRRTQLRAVPTALAALGVLLATATVHSQTQTETTHPPQVRQPAPTRGVQQPVAPRQRPAVNTRQSVPNTNAANQLRNLLNNLGSRNVNRSATSPSQSRSPIYPATRTNASPYSQTRTSPSLRLSTAARLPQGTSRLSTSRIFAGQLAPPGSYETRSPNGAIVRKAADGSILAVANPRNGMLIQHGVDGSRRILVSQPDRTRIFASSRGIEYVQHPYTYRGRAYDHRTYYFQGRTVHRYYRPYRYGGATLDAYAPTRFYPMNFYRWTVSSFRPTPIQWNYTNQPWFRYYRGYFTPDAAYSSPLGWLADFVIGASLVTAYNAAQQSQQPPPPPDGTSAITPEVKQMLAEEFRRQINQEVIEAQQNASNISPPPGAGGVVAELRDGQTHVFMVGSDLDLVDASGRRCMMSEGDAVAVVSPVKADTNTADAIVMSSKGGNECERSVRVQLALNDVQEVQNYTREAMDQGLASTNAAKTVPAVTPAFAQAGPPADPNAAQEIEQQQELAAATEG